MLQVGDIPHLKNCVNKIFFGSFVQLIGFGNDDADQ